VQSYRCVYRSNQTPAVDERTASVLDWTAAIKNGTSRNGFTIEPLPEAFDTGRAGARSRALGAQTLVV
jgi:hypothetical protein